MSAFKNPNFVMEFAYRTKINYFNLRLLQENDVEESSRIDDSLNSIKREMEKKGYVISDFYEVTQLINSLIGLLVFPEQACYKYLSTNPEDLDHNYPILASYVNGQKGKYVNTYCEEGNSDIPGKSSTKSVLKHLRNAVAHDRLSIFPENGRLSDGTNIIQAVTFKDQKKKEEFEITIDVEDLEGIIMEICDGIINMAK